MPSHIPSVDILAPLSGVCLPLERTPDPVFAGRLVGDGVSLDPTSQTLLSPADGTITQIHASCHAMTLRMECGADLLVHVGLDTVQLRGTGFRVLVKEGDPVLAGQPLLRFDADVLARRARCLVTPVLVTGGATIAWSHAPGMVVAGQTVLMRLIPEQENLEGDGASWSVGTPLRLPNPEGLHARPAARLGEMAKRFQAQVRLRKEGRSANLRSVVALLGLGTVRGDLLTVEGSGPDAEAAIQALSAFLTAGAGDDLSLEPPTPAAAQADIPPGCLGGIPASPGMAIGRVFHLRATLPEFLEQGEGRALETAMLSEALEAADRDLASPSSGILAAHRALLTDPELWAAAEAQLAHGSSAGHAWRKACEAQAMHLESLSNAVLRERATDLRDVMARVLRHLAGTEARFVDIPPGSIVIAEHLAPSDVAAFDPTCVVGFATPSGGATGHVAILARGAGLPALCGADRAVLSIPEGTEVLLNATHGLLDPAPMPEALADLQATQTAAWARRDAEAAAALEPAITLDGRHIAVGASLTRVEEAARVHPAGGDGVGLVRTEFLFEGRNEAPSEDAQAEVYATLAASLRPNQPLVIRTLDAGGDKPLAFLPLAPEENPMLGLRGLRVGLAQPEILRPQLRALLRTAGTADLHILLPMVTEVSEIRAVKAMIQEEALDLGLATHSLKLGAMVEVPAAALLADLLAPELDFFSLGTNDLTQYALAMDRGHAELSTRADALHPAVLRLIRTTVTGAHAHGKWVGVCGTVAGDLEALPILLGLGVDELAVPLPALPSIKARIRTLEHQACQDLATRALAMDGAAAVRALVRSAG